MNPGAAVVTQADPTLFRGPRIASPEHAIWLKRHCGVKTVLSLETGFRDMLDGYPANDEARWCNSLDMNRIVISLGGLWPPHFVDVESAFYIMNDPRHRPLYFHCRAGRERTGFMAAVQLMAARGWTFAQAYDEWARIGGRQPTRWLWKRRLAEYGYKLR